MLACRERRPRRAPFPGAPLVQRHGADTRVNLRGSVDHPEECMAVDDRWDALPAAEPGTQRFHGLGFRRKDVMPDDSAMHELAGGRVHGDELPRQGVVARQQAR